MSNQSPTDNNSPPSTTNVEVLAERLNGVRGTLEASINGLRETLNAAVDGVKGSIAILLRVVIVAVVAAIGGFGGLFWYSSETSSKLATVIAKQDANDKMLQAVQGDLRTTRDEMKGIRETLQNLALSIGRIDRNTRKAENSPSPNAPTPSPIVANKIPKNLYFVLPQQAVGTFVRGCALKNGKLVCGDDAPAKACLSGERAACKSLEEWYVLQIVQALRKSNDVGTSVLVVAHNEESESALKNLVKYGAAFQLYRTNVLSAPFR